MKLQSVISIFVVIVAAMFFVGCTSNDVKEISSAAQQGQTVGAEYAKNSDLITNCKIGELTSGCVLVKTTDNTLHLTLTDTAFANITSIENIETGVLENGKGINCTLVDYRLFNPFDAETGQKYGNQFLNLTFSCSDSVSNSQTYQVVSKIHAVFTKPPNYHSISLPMKFGSCSYSKQDVTADCTIKLQISAKKKA